MNSAERIARPLKRDGERKMNSAIYIIVAVFSTFIAGSIYTHIAKTEYPREVQRTKASDAITLVIWASVAIFAWLRIASVIAYHGATVQ